MMKCIFLCLIFLCSCSLFDKKSGGENTYRYQTHHQYQKIELETLSQDFIKKSWRDPFEGQYETIFDKRKFPIKKVGIVVFESEIQPTRGGLSEKNIIYLSSAGKQLLTENLLQIWEDQLAGDDYISTRVISENKAFRNYGVEQEDHALFKNQVLGEEDIFLIESGKKVSSDTVMNPRWMRDFSLVYIPAFELMKGSKWNEHQKHMLNELSQALNLDALIIVKSDLSWLANSTDKRSGAHQADELKVKIQASVLLPYGKLHLRHKELHFSTRPYINTVLGNYEADYSGPISLSQDFKSINDSLMVPMIKIYSDLTQMLLFKIKSDLK